MVVDMKELHQALKITTSYKMWVKSLLDSKKENMDYWLADNDYVISIDFARSLCLLQGNKVGKEVYKILDRKYNTKECLLMRLKAADEEISRLKAKIEADKPKVRFANALGTSSGCISIGELATILTQNGFPIGCNRLFEKLRNDGYLLSKTSKNLPSQKALDLGLFEVERSFCFIRGIGMTDIQKPVVTPKGQLFLLNKYLAFIADNRVVPEIFYDEDLIGD